MSVTLIPVSVICEITASLAAMQFTQLTSFFLISTEKLLFSAAEVCVQYLTLEINIILEVFEEKKCTSFFYWLSYVIIIWICKIQVNRWLLVWAINLWKLVMLIYTHKIEEILRPYFTFFFFFHMGILQSLPSHSSITTVWKLDLYVLIWETNIG